MHVLAAPTMANPSFWNVQEKALLDSLAERLPHTDASGILKLRHDLMLLRGAIQSSRLCVTLTDMTLPDQPLAFVNPAFERMTGYRAQDCLGRNCRFLQGEDTDPDAVDQLRSAIGAGATADVTLLNYRSDGTPFWNRVLLRPVHDTAGRLTAYIGHQLGEAYLGLPVSPLGQLSSSESQ